jgi:hypothetical protein
MRGNQGAGRTALNPGRPAGWPLDPLGLGSGPHGPRVKYTPMVMMILSFGQLHFVTP